MSQQSFEVGQMVEVIDPSERHHNRFGTILNIARGSYPYAVSFVIGHEIAKDYFNPEQLKPYIPPRRDAYTPGRDAIPPQPAPILPKRTREQEEVIRKLEAAAARTSLPVQPGEVETLPNGAKQSKLGHWWSTPYAALAVARVMSEGHAKYDEPGSTPAQGNWHGIPIWSNIQHAITHLMLYAVGDKSEDHLAHAATRLMMALDQRESGRQPE